MVQKNVAEILQNHVTLELEGIDRMYLNGYVPSLQTGAGAAYFMKTQLDAIVPSTFWIAPMSRDFIKAIEQFVKDEEVDLVRFRKGQRKDDLADLVWYFVNLYAREVRRHITRLDPVMMDIFAKYDWPGNVRQLRNVVRTSLILGVGETLSLADVSWLFDELQPLTQQQCGPGDSACLESSSSCSERTQSGPGLGGLPLEQVERRAILDTLRQTGGNQTKAAKVLGISDRTLRERIHRYRRQGCLQSA